MTRLFHCKTHYHLDPPVDINPLILQKYSDGKILVLCARQSMMQRIGHFLKEWDRESNVLACGWWEMGEFGLVDSEGEVDYCEILSYDAVVVVGRDRINEAFIPLVEAVERVFDAS